MLQKNLLMISALIAFCSSASALSEMDENINRLCGSVCNGESPDCDQCYRNVVQLYDQKSPVSPEIDFDIDNNHGKLELEIGH